MFDLMKMMGKIKDAQGKIQEAQKEMGKLTTEAETGAGLVKVKVNGHRQVVELKVEDELMKPEEKEMLQDLVSAAVNKAMADIDKIVKEEMAKRTQDLMPSIPGLDLNSILGNK